MADTTETTETTTEAEDIDVLRDRLQLLLGVARNGDWECADPDTLLDALMGIPGLTGYDHEALGEALRKRPQRWTDVTETAIFNAFSDVPLMLQAEWMEVAKKVGVKP